ncbi:MAG TPA: twin-arginine translocase TatA/TatE family subunit [Anaeromyxobacter sp.]|nr:twin-arginine translocase TatA/TatE family subunit [Anaeromyxobacter sp.]
MFGLKTSELLLILAIVVILLGASRLPQIGSALGRSIRGLTAAIRDEGEKPGTSDSGPF